MKKEAVFKWAVIDDLLIAFGTPGAVSDRDWDSFFKQLLDLKIKKHLGATIGAIEVTSVQRKAAAEVFKARKIPAVIVTDASLVRGLVTAVSWMGANIKAVDWPELRKGLDHLGVTGPQQERAVEVIMALRATHELRPA